MSSPIEDPKQQRRSERKAIEKEARSEIGQDLVENALGPLGQLVFDVALSGATAPISLYTWGKAIGWRFFKGKNPTLSFEEDEDRIIAHDADASAYFRRMAVRFAKKEAYKKGELIAGTVASLIRTGFSIYNPEAGKKGILVDIANNLLVPYLPPDVSTFYHTHNPDAINTLVLTGIFAFSQLGYIALDKAKVRNYSLRYNRSPH